MPFDLPDSGDKPDESSANIESSTTTESGAKPGPDRSETRSAVQDALDADGSDDSQEPDSGIEPEGKGDVPGIDRDDGREQELSPRRDPPQQNANVPPPGLLEIPGWEEAVAFEGQPSRPHPDQPNANKLVQGGMDLATGALMVFGTVAAGVAQWWRRRAP